MIQELFENLVFLWSPVAFGLDLEHFYGVDGVPCHLKIDLRFGTVRGDPVSEMG
ncbi:MAG: hypothetical protein ABIK86_07035 [candidate division WOR-3 bacterium]